MKIQIHCERAAPAASRSPRHWLICCVLNWRARARNALGATRAGQGQGSARARAGRLVGSPDSLGTAGAVSGRPPADACLDLSIAYTARNSGSAAARQRRRRKRERQREKELEIYLYNTWFLNFLWVIYSLWQLCYIQDVSVRYFLLQFEALAVYFSLGEDSILKVHFIFNL